MREVIRRRHRLVGAAAVVAALGVAATSGACASASPTPPHSTPPQSTPPRSALPRGDHRPTELIGAAACAANRAAGTIVFASPFGYDASAGILDVVEAQRLGYFSDLCLSVDFLGTATNAVGTVSAGAATITGEGSAADLLAADAVGDHLVGIATFGDTSDYALLTRPSITNLRQLAGKTLGYHYVVPVAISEMLKAAGVDTAKVTFVNDTSYDPFLLTEGKFDALQAYQSNEPIALRAAHAAFREYVPASFGVKGTFNVQVVNATFLARHRQAVADFLLAELHAFDYCAVHQAQCIAGEAAAAKSAGVSYDSTHNLAEWRFEVALAEDHRLAGAGIGVESYAEWRPEADAVVAFHVVKAVPALAKVEDPALAASLYDKTTLRWP